MNSKQTPRVEPADAQKMDQPDEEAVKLVNELKQQADGCYKEARYDQAVDVYQRCLEALDGAPKSHLAATIYFNMSLCSKYKKDDEKQLDNLYRCIETDTRYRRARVALAKLLMDRKEFVSAQIEWQNVTEIGELNDEEKKLKETCDKESVTVALDTLKGWGNKLLGKFGMSLDDFKMQKNPDGTMSMSMQKTQQ